MTEDFKNKYVINCVESLTEHFSGVALAIEALQNVFGVDVPEVLGEFPSGLTPLYDQMMKRIEALQRRSPQRCLIILSTVIPACRPLHMREIHIAAGLQEEIPHLADLQRFIDISQFVTITSILYINQQRTI
jgi:hypothetical protein